MMIVLARSTSRRGSCRRQKKAPSDSLQQHQRHMRSRSHAMQLSSVWRALDGMQTRCRNLQARQGRLLRPLLTCAAAWTRQRQPRVAWQEQSRTAVIPDGSQCRSPRSCSYGKRRGGQK